MRNETMKAIRMTFMTLGFLVGALFMASLVPPLSEAVDIAQITGMIGNGDHAGLAEYYKKQAEEARKNAAGMKTMASEYLKKYPKNQYNKHCEKMEDMYLKEAKEYETLAEMHSKAGKPAGK